MEDRENKKKERKSRVQFIVVREFAGNQSMEEAFKHLIEKEVCSHFEEWREEKVL